MKRQTWWKLAVVAGVPLVVASVAAPFLWRQYLLELPPAPQPQVLLPNPNGRDDFLAAIDLLPKQADVVLTRRRKVNGRPVSTPYGIPTPELRALVRDSQPALARLRVGLKRQFLNPFPVFDGPDPEFRGYRTLARLLAAEAELAKREGKSGQGARSSLDAVRMGSLVPRGGGVIPGLHGEAINSIGIGSLERALDTLNAEQSLRAARELEELDRAFPPLAALFAVERDSSIIAFTDLLRRGRLPGVALELEGGRTEPTPAEAMVAASKYSRYPRRYWIDCYREHMNTWIVRSQLDYVPLTESNQPQQAAGIMRGITAMNSGISLAFRKGQAVRRIAITRLALRAFQLRARRLPQTLSELAPNYLPALPDDPFGTEPLLYRVVEGKPRVYSRGPDGDDDRGWQVRNLEVSVNGDITGIKRER